MCARVRVCACVLVVLYWQDASGRPRVVGGLGMRAKGGGARTGWSAREGFAAVSLPPRLDPVVKMPGEAGPGPPGSLQEEAGAGKEGSGGPAWACGPEEPGSLGGPVFSFPASRAARLQDAPTCSHPSSDKAEIRGPDGEPRAWWPSLLGLHPATRKLESWT